MNQRQQLTFNEIMTEFSKCRRNCIDYATVHEMTQNVCQLSLSPIKWDPTEAQNHIKMNLKDL